MKTFSDLINTFGVGVTAEILGVTRKHVFVMRARNSIPPVYWGEILKAAPKYNVEDLSFEKCRELRDARSEVHTAT